MEQSEKRAQNPNNQLTPEQRAEQRRRKGVFIAPKVPKQFGVVPKTNPKVEKQDGPTYRNTSHQDNN